MKYVIQFLFSKIGNVAQNKCRNISEYKHQNMSLYVCEERLWYSTDFEFDYEAEDG